jgi:uncharacterized GH25 family protein
MLDTTTNRVSLEPTNRKPFIMRRLLPTVLFVAGIAFPAMSHEFWISPETYVVDPGSSIRAEFRVGQNMKGSGFSFLDFQSERFDYVTAQGTRPVPARMGDRPALNLEAPVDNGLVVVVHQTVDSELTYREWDKFVAFTEHKDFTWALDEHRAHGWPETGFKESYRRHAKSLVAVGDGAGTDSFSGMAIEIVAVTNPYTDDLSGGMIVDVIYENAPRANEQVELFEKSPEGEVVITRHRTDTTGRAVLPVKGGHEYLVDSVVIRLTGNEDIAAGPVWHSLWGSLTFKTPL